MTLKLSNAAARAMLAALTALVPAGKLKIYTGTAPVNVETAATGTLLATLALNATAFAAPAGADGADATALANAITSAAATQAGTAGYFRITKADDTAVWQGRVGNQADVDGGAPIDLLLGTKDLTVGSVVSVSAYTLTEPVVGS